MDLKQDEKIFCLSLNHIISREGLKEKNFNFGEKGVDFLSQGVVCIILPVELAMLF